MAVDADRPLSDPADTVAGVSPLPARPNDVPELLAGVIGDKYAAEELERRTERTEAAIRRAMELQ